MEGAASWGFRTPGPPPPKFELEGLGRCVGCRDLGLRLRDEDLRLGLDLSFRYHGLGKGALASGFRLFRVSGSGFRDQGVGMKV